MTRGKTLKSNQSRLVNQAYAVLQDGLIAHRCAEGQTCFRHNFSMRERNYSLAMGMVYQPLDPNVNEIRLLTIL